MFFYFNLFFELLTLEKLAKDIRNSKENFKATYVKISCRISYNNKN